MELRLALIGAGGTGTILLEPLARYLLANVPQWHLGIIDGDTFDSTNSGRQLFDRDDTGLNKAIAAATRTKAALGLTDATITAVDEYLGADNIADLITDGTIVLIAVDSYRTRAIIENHCASLPNVAVINGGNEMSDGSCQIWIRKDGENLTPPISFMHPEINSGGTDRSKMSCHQIAALPGGGQLITANMMSATWMLAALDACLARELPLWTDLTFDLVTGKAAGMNATPLRGWR